MMQMLASVTNIEEALIALQAGVDIIDLKNPAGGALGALPLSIIKQVVAAIDSRAITSATIGDLPMQPELLLEAVKQISSAGVDIVKVGFFANGNHQACIDAMEPVTTTGQHIVAVLFADEAPDFELLPQFHRAGFYGVMLDTSHKGSLNLTHHISDEGLRQFVSLARKHSLKSGLAGSLGLLHVQKLAVLNPDYVGFRGALCIDLQRESIIDKTKVFELRKLLRESNKTSLNAIEA